MTVERYAVGLLLVALALAGMWGLAEGLAASHGLLGLRVMGGIAGFAFLTAVFVFGVSCLKDDA